MAQHVPATAEADQLFMDGASDELAPFAVPAATWRGGDRLEDGSITMPWCELDAAGDRLVAFAYHGSYEWVDDPKREEQRALLERLSTGAADDPVEGDTDDLWRCLFAVVRADRFTEGLVGSHAHALTRIANELRRRLLEERRRRGGSS